MIKNVNIINYWHTQYGGIITAYALQEIVKELGYNCKLINNMLNWESQVQKKSFNKIFEEKYLSVTPRITPEYNLENLNENANIFITGSDQVFRTKYITHLISQYLLTFTSPDKKRIAFSASFGVGKEQFLKETSEKDMEIMKEALQSFDYVSVREKSGVEMCQNLFDVNAEWIIDPVFILNRQKYENLALKSNKDYKNKIVSYVLRPNKEYKKAYNYLEKKYNTKVEPIAYTNIIVEDWLNAIKNSNLLLTDSFHGVCFAILFSKPFICISQDINGKARLDSIFEMLGIENQSIISPAEVCTKDCIFNINYNCVNQKIEEEAKKGIDILKKVLESPVSHIKEKEKLRITYFKNKISELEKQNNILYQIKKYFMTKFLVIYFAYLPRYIKNLISFIRQILKGEYK